MEAAGFMRAGNNFLRCTDAEGGRERPGKALLGAGRPRTGGVDKCGTPWEQVQGALVPPPCEPAFSRQGAVRGRAAWPRLRRHLADKIRLPQIIRNS